MSNSSKARHDDVSARSNKTNSTKNKNNNNYKQVVNNNNDDGRTTRSSPPLMHPGIISLSPVREATTTATKTTTVTPTKKHESLSCNDDDNGYNCLPDHVLVLALEQAEQQWKAASNAKAKVNAAKNSSPRRNNNRNFIAAKKRRRTTNRQATLEEEDDDAMGPPPKKKSRQASDDDNDDDSSAITTTKISSSANISNCSINRVAVVVHSPYQPRATTTTTTTSSNDCLLRQSLHLHHHLQQQAPATTKKAFMMPSSDNNDNNKIMNKTSSPLLEVKEDMIIQIDDDDDEHPQHEQKHPQQLDFSLTQMIHEDSRRENPGATKEQQKLKLLLLELRTSLEKFANGILSKLLEQQQNDSVSHRHHDRDSHRHPKKKTNSNNLKQTIDTLRFWRCSSSDGGKVVISPEFAMTMHAIRELGNTAAHRDWELPSRDIVTPVVNKYLKCKQKYQEEQTKIPRKRKKKEML